MKKLRKDNLIEEGYEPGQLITESVYILVDGTLWDGGFDMGSRGVEHREVEAFTELDRYDGKKFWEEVMVEKGLVMVVPEWKEVLIHPDHTPTEEQDKKIAEAKKAGFEIGEFN